MPKQKLENIQLTNNQSTLSAHIFKKRKLINNDELDIYLKSETANYDLNILDYWKVKY
jgi:hypothetical protein